MDLRPGIKPVQAHGKEASWFTRDLLRGESVYVVHVPGQAERDKYGRLLAYLYRVPDGLFVNAEIIRQSYGPAYAKCPFRQMESFRHYEGAAQKAVKGLWGLPPDRAEAVVEATTGRSVGKGATVYVTRSGRKCHRGGCRHLVKSKSPMELIQAAERYGPCSVCSP